MSIDLVFYLAALGKFTTGFIIIATYLKLAHKLQGGQLTSIDYIGNFVLGGIISGVIYNRDIPFHRFLLVLLIATGLIALLNYISMNVLVMRRAVTSEAHPIIVDGMFQIQSDEEKKQRNFDLIHFMAKLRAQGIYSLEEVDFAQIESEGSLTVIKKGEGVRNMLLASQGEPLTRTLESIGHDEEWLLGQLEAHDIDIADVYLVELSKGNHLYIVRCDGSAVSADIQESSTLP